MANLIDYTYLDGKLTLGLTMDAASQQLITKYIDEYEPEFLLSLMGFSLNKLFAANPNEQIYKDIKEGKEFINMRGLPDKWPGLVYTKGTVKKSPIANYVYYWYMRKQATSTTPSGEKKTKTQNAEDTSPAVKMSSAWYEMKETCKKFIDFMYANTDTYPAFDDHHDPSLLINLTTPVNPCL